MRAVRLLSLVCLASCQRDPKALTDGASWLTRTPPPALATRVASYEERQFFGVRTDPYGWRRETRYTLRADLPDADAGCSFVEWIPGGWARRGSVLVVTTPDSDSGSLETFGCPKNPEPRTVPRSPHFTRAESDFTLDGRTLRLESEFGALPPYSVELAREN